MSNRIIRVFATIIFALMPFLVLSEKIETQISADTITVQRGGILYAEGNVVVRYGTNKIKARALEFNQKSNQIKFTELKDFDDGKAIKFSAEEALISSDLNEGIIRTANLLIDDAIKQIELLEHVKDKVYKIRVFKIDEK